VSYLLTAGETQILIDCGSGAVSRLQEVSHWNNLSAVILSHLHGDHMSDMLVLKYAVYLDMLDGKRKEPLIVYCPAEPAAERSLLDYKGAVKVVPVGPGDTLDVGGVTVKFVAAVHSIPALSMSFEHGGKRLVYSGDTEPNPALRELAEGADMLLCEATLTEDRKAPGHMTGADAGRLAKEAGVGRLLVTHFEVRFPDRRSMQEARGVFVAATEVEEGVSYEV
jgi:ribonuclease BN (tRNA processing enzyme)